MSVPRTLGHRNDAATVSLRNYWRAASIKPRYRRWAKRLIAKQARRGAIQMFSAGIHGGPIENCEAFLK